MEQEPDDKPRQDRLKDKVQDEVDRLFERAVELPVEDRSAWLDGHCDDDEVRRKVDSLLAYFDSPSPSLEGGLRLGSPAGARDQSLGEAIPEHVGDYRVLRVLGAGGMGIVYLAEHPSTHRKVALKVLHTGLASDEYARRFRHEVALLARIQDTAVAQIHDAGTTGSGVSARAYLVMEYVDGHTLTRYAEEQRLDLAARVELLVRVAEAAHAAHVHGVIHRDLKPDNVLVTTKGQVKVIDFGVARAVEQDADLTARTRTGQVIGTLAYVSPEQVRGDVKSVDIRTDVYSLGVIAYELLGRRLPLDLDGLTLTEAGRRVCEIDAPRLSSIEPACRGDLDWIVAKALEKEPSRRYQSARAFAEDLARYLRSEPVDAGPASAAYVLKKTARRHRVALIGAAATLVAVLVGAGVAVRFAVVNKRLAEEQTELRTVAEGRADALAEQSKELTRKTQELTQKTEELTRQSEELRQVTLFQDQMMGGFDGRVAGERLKELVRADVEARIVQAGLNREQVDVDEVFARLDGAGLAKNFIDVMIFEPSRDLLDEAFADQPRVRAQLLTSIGRARNNLTLPGAEEPLRTAYETFREEYGPENHWTLNAAWLLAIAVQDLDEREQLLVYFLEHVDAASGLDHLRGSASSLLAWIVTQRHGYERGIEAYEELLASGTLDDPRFDLDRITLQKHLGKLYAVVRRYEDAERMQRDVVDELVHSVGEEHRLTAGALEGLGTTLAATGRFEEAEPILQRALVSMSAIRGRKHPRTVTLIGNLGKTLAKLKRWDEAAPLLRELCDATPASASAEKRIDRLCDLATALMELEELDETEARLTQAFELARGVGSPSLGLVLKKMDELVAALRERAQSDADGEWAARADALDGRAASAR